MNWKSKWPNLNSRFVFFFDSKLDSILICNKLTVIGTCNKMSPQPVKSTQMSISERRNKRRKVVYFLSDSFEKMSIETRLPTMPIARSIGVNVFFSMSETSFSDEFIFFFLFCFFRLNF